MKCFYHPSSEAVGICKNCPNGLCPECAADVGDGLACRGRCESKVTAVNALLEKSTSVSKVGGIGVLVMMATLALCWIAALGIGMLDPKFLDDKLLVAILVGSALLVVFWVGKRSLR